MGAVVPVETIQSSLPITPATSRRLLKTASSMRRTLKQGTTPPTSVTIIDPCDLLQVSYMIGAAGTRQVLAPFDVLNGIYRATIPTDLPDVSLGMCVCAWGGGGGELDECTCVADVGVSGKWGGSKLAPCNRLSLTTLLFIPLPLHTKHRVRRALSSGPSTRPAPQRFPPAPPTPPFWVTSPSQLQSASRRLFACECSCCSMVQVLAANKIFHQQLIPQQPNCCRCTLITPCAASSSPSKPVPR